jgi:hypothetical protein
MAWQRSKRKNLLRTKRQGNATKYYEGIAMSYPDLPVPQYPAWDGTTPNREDLDSKISPLWQDWDQLTVEVLTHQNTLSDLSDLVTTISTADNQIVLLNSSAPTVPTNSFAMYANDQTAGNAAPHFKTEAGQVVKLYQQAHKADVTGSSGDTDPEARAAINGLYDVLENLGFLAAS